MAKRKATREYTNLSPSVEVAVDAEASLSRRDSRRVALSDEDADILAPN